MKFTLRLSLLTLGMVFFMLGLSGSWQKTFAGSANASFNGSGKYTDGTFGGSGCNNFSFSTSFLGGSCIENPTGSGFIGSCTGGSGSISFGFDGSSVGSAVLCGNSFTTGGSFSSMSYSTDFSHNMTQISFTVVAGVANNYGIFFFGNPRSIANGTYNNARDYSTGIFSGGFNSQDIPIVPTVPPLPTRTPTPTSTLAPTAIPGATKTPTPSLTQVPPPPTCTSPTIQIDGMFSADHNFIVETNGTPPDLAVHLSGAVIYNAGHSGGQFNQERDLGNDPVTGNGVNPAFTISARSDMILNMPDLLKIHNRVYKELAP